MAADTATDCHHQHANAQHPDRWSHHTDERVVPSGWRATGGAAKVNPPPVQGAGDDDWDDVDEIDELDGD